jgi:superfamily II DNA or RNA helicase
VGFMLRKVISTLEKKYVLNFLDKRVYSYLSGNIEYQDILNDKMKLINLVLEQNQELFVRNADLRTILVNGLDQEEMQNLQTLLNSKLSRIEFLRWIHIQNSSAKFIEMLMDFFHIKAQPKSKNEIVSKIVQSNSDRFYELLDYQYIIKAQVIQLLKQKPTLFRMIIHMPTGTGKTKTTNHIIIHNYVFNQKKNGVLLWLAHTRELVNQAYQTFLKTWTVLGEKEILVRVNDLEILPENNCIIFMSYQKLISLHKNNKSTYKNLIKKVSGIVADEAHKCLARETRLAIEGLMTKKELDNNKYLIGLTATPGRKFGATDDSEENEALALMFERRIFSIEPKKINYMKLSEIEYRNVEHYDKEIIKYFQSRGVLSKIKREVLYYVTKSKIPKVNSSTKLTHDVLLKYSNINERNKVIISRLVELNADKVPTIVFACSVDHGKFIENVLRIQGISCKGVYGDMNKSIRQQNIDDFNTGKIDILINFEVLTTGFDSPRIECVFITRLTNSIVLYSQMIGRGLRGPLMGGNETCLLIDIKDNFDKFSDENEAFKYFEEYWEGK